MSDHFEEVYQIFTEFMQDPEGYDDWTIDEKRRYHIICNTKYDQLLSSIFQKHHRVQKNLKLWREKVEWIIKIRPYVMVLMSNATIREDVFVME